MEVGNLHEKLFANRYRPDTSNHLQVKNGEQCQRCHRYCETLCPAGVYRWDGIGLVIDYDGCLECGTCRLVCPYDNIEWNLPRGGYGVSYRFG